MRRAKVSQPMHIRPPQKKEPTMTSRARRLHFPKLVVPVLIAALAALLWPAPSSAETNFDRTLSGDRVAVHNLVGTLRVVKGEGSTVAAGISLLGEDAGLPPVDDGTH